MAGRSRIALRTGLALFTALEALIGIWALGFPQGFYDFFPLPGHHWVTLLVRTVLFGYLFYSVPHLIFHADHLDNFSTTDAVVQTLVLPLSVVLPLIMLALTSRTEAARRS